MTSKRNSCGGVHPRTLIQREIEDIFLSMGFDVLDGPHVEDEFHNWRLSIFLATIRPRYAGYLLV